MLICGEWPESPHYWGRYPGCSDREPSCLLTASLIFLLRCHGAHVGHYDVSIKLNRDTAHGNSNPPGASIFWLKPEVFCRNVVPGQLLGRQQNIPSHETPPAEIPAWDACGFQKLLKGIFSYSRKSLVLQVCNYVGQSLWFGFCNQLRNGKYLCTFEVGSILPDSILFILFQAFLFCCCPGDWRCWHCWCPLS